MKKLCLVLLMLMLVSCSGKEPEISRYPEPNMYTKEAYEVLPDISDSYEIWRYDFRGMDVSHLDFKDSLEILKLSSFDTRTKWPDALHESYDPNQVMAMGKNPGLGVRSLHEQGITGKGISVAIIDQVLLVDHEEYADRIQYYNEENISADYATMHGGAVTSILAGKSVGVAPESTIYYIATEAGKYTNNEFERDLSYMATAIDHLVEINEALKESEKIRVISISLGWMPGTEGYETLMASIERAKEANIFVCSVSTDRSYDVDFIGLGRDVLKDPDEFSSYQPGLFYYDHYLEDSSFCDWMPMIPMDSRTTASPAGTSDYVFYSDGGMSWAVPYFAGVYALACQVDPDITVDEFYKAVSKTSYKVDLVDTDDQTARQWIIDPVALIDELQED